MKRMFLLVVTLVLALLFAVPVLAQDTPPVVSTSSDAVPVWLQLVLDNIEWIAVTLLSILLYRSVPPGAFEKGLQRAKESAAKTATPDDDKLVSILEGVYALLRNLIPKQDTASLTTVEATVDVPVTRNTDGSYTANVSQGLQEAAQKFTASGDLQRDMDTIRSRPDPTGSL